MRSLYMLIILQSDPDKLDAASYEDRRAWGGGWRRIDLLHDGDPSVVVRRALDLDQGVYAEHRRFDEADTSVVETSAIFHAGLARAADLLKPYLDHPTDLAERLAEEAGEDEDVERIARALVEPLSDPALGAGEEAATWVRVFLESVPEALRLKNGIAWEIRRRVHCECAVWDGRTLGRDLEFPRFLQTTGGDRLRCTRCGSEYTFERNAWDVNAELVPRPLPKLPELAQQIAAAVGGRVAFNLTSQPAAAIQVGDHCRILVTCYGPGFLVRVPNQHPRKLWTHEDWLAFKPVLEELLSEPAVPSVCDVILALARPTIDWVVSFEDGGATLFRGRGELHVLQNAASVTLSVRDGATTHTREVTTLEGVPAWIDEKTAAQGASREAAAAAIHRQLSAERAAMRVPELAEVLAVLSAGESIQVGGGRSFPTYEMRDGRLIVIQCDDGRAEERAIGEDELRAAIAEAPNVFDAAVQRRRA